MASNEGVNFCFPDQIIDDIYWFYVEPVIVFFVLIMTIAATIHFIRGYIKSEIKIPKILFCYTLMFISTTLLFLILWVPSLILQCIDNSLFQISLHILTLLYSSQIWLFLGIFYYRMESIFHTNKRLSLSKCNKIFFWSYYILIMMISIPSSMTWSTFPILPILSVIAFMLTINLSIYLVILFVYKLRKAYQVINDENDDLINLASKTALLAIISILSTLATSFFVSLEVPQQSIHFRFIFDLIIIADTQTNFWCIILSFKYFGKYYGSICGKCDSSCKTFWGGRFKHDDIKNLEKHSETNGSAHVTV